jgi:hypothetical protein
VPAVSLQDAANLAQVISAVAVVVSLLFLAMQVRRAGRDVLVSAQQAQATAHAQYMMALATDPVLTQLLAKSLTQAPLTPLEQAQASFYFNAVFVQFQATWHSACQLGARDRENWRHMERALARWARDPYARAWWAADRELFAEDFRGLFDKMMAEAGPPPPQP